MVTMLDNARCMVHDVYMLNPTVTKSQVVAAVDALRALYAIIAEAGPQGIPSGHIYAHVMGHTTLGNFEAMVAMLVRTGLVKSEGHLLTVTALPA